MNPKELHDRAAVVRTQIDLAEELLQEAVTNSGHRKVTRAPSGPERLKEALQLSGQACEELRRALQTAVAKAYTEWHEKWQLNPDRIHVKGERVGTENVNESMDFDAEVKLRWELG